MNMIQNACNSKVVEDIEEQIEELLEYQKLMQQSHVGGGESCLGYVIFGFSGLITWWNDKTLFMCLRYA